MTASVPRESNQSIERRPNAKFPRSMRLLRHSDFERVYKEGRRHFSASMTVFYLRQPDAAVGAKITGLRVGFTVGRALGGAVQRNRIKRRLREAVRLTIPAKATGADVVINPKKGFLAADFEAVMNEVRQAFVVIEKKVRSTDPFESNKGTTGGRRPEPGIE